jgi:hypothetical protein
VSVALHGGSNPILSLRRFTQPKVVPEICDFCSVSLDQSHRHLLELSGRKILCVCPPCALRFENVIGGRFLLIPRDIKLLPDFKLSDGQWEDLALPINLVFIFNQSLGGTTVAVYPSPAGATESMLTIGNWNTIVAENSALESLKPDVEALLINRVGASREYFIVPMDVCFELVGLIRKNWRGFTGGEEVWSAIHKFFAGLRETAVPEKSKRKIYA